MSDLWRVYILSDLWTVYISNHPAKITLCVDGRWVSIGRIDNIDGKPTLIAYADVPGCGQPIVEMK